MPENAEIKKGDRVIHRLFGRGTVIDTLPLGGDTVVTIEFDNGTVRKLCAVVSGLELDNTTEITQET
ncbi:MAG: hypothetical protein IKW96_13630 [Ruminococcus sp.]|uniref:hypothetical protein n=1 Tax=Ruminococcus sp. TaxID=41978 RepID=UPI0025D071EF|nr:hypothetical protein [Ruminococcus sp.]MBR5684289.1 hypothetical protein [Ruminococcus sp.]